MLDRSIAPPSSSIKSIDITKASSLVIPGSKVPFHFLTAGKQPVLKFEFTAEIDDDSTLKAGLARLMVKMLLKGTKTRTAYQLAEELDAYGAFIDASSSLDRLNISVYCLKKHFRSTMDIFWDMLHNSTFPQEELNLLINQSKQELKVNLEKSAYIASRLLRKKLYPNSGYGVVLTEEALNKITRADIDSFYTNHFYKDINIFLSGAVSDEEIHDIEQRFSDLKVLHKTKARGSQIKTVMPGVYMVDQPKAIQSSIRLGKITIAKSDPNYSKIFLSNQLLGGFFGSRLMKNIREEKGLSYGIYSSLVHASRSSFMVIGAEVALEKTQKALDEIYAEIKKLRDEPPGLEELELVRNYTLGKLLSSIDTPFSLMEKFKSIYFNNLDYQFYDLYVEKLNSIIPEDIMEMANQYMSNKDLTTVVVGGGLS